MSLFYEWEVAIAKKYVRQFRSTNRCLERDFEDDLVDECLKHWFFLRDTVKPEAEEKRRAYMVRIVKNKLIDIVRSRCAEKRHEFYQAVPIDDFLEDSLASPQQSPAEAIDLAELKSQLNRAFQKLNLQQKQIYEAIYDGQLTITQISARLNLHRSTVYDAIKSIREIFEREGLKTFL